MDMDHGLTTAQTLSPQAVAAYRQDGFVKIPRILSQEEAARFHEAATRCIERKREQMGHMYRDAAAFTQLVNVWLHDPEMRRLTLHPNVAAVAQRLAGVPLRLWHDHILCKMPRKSTHTEFHQDQPYWPHANSAQPISAWIALCDVPVERGCMSFIPGTHRLTGLQAQNLNDAQSLFTLRPELRWEPRVTLPLRAGDCTFHHGCCAHMATPNLTDDPRMAHVVIYIDEQTTYRDKGHVVTDPLKLVPGRRIEGDLFPTVDAIVDGAAAVPAGSAPQ